METDLTLAERVSSEVASSSCVLSDTRGRSVSVFGSARLKPGNPWYEAARQISKTVSAAGIHIISGGGPGIMEAANKGAKEGGVGLSIGLNINLPFETCGNDYQDVSIQFDHFASRKIAFCRHSEVFLYMPGGFGTLDELGEVLTLIQTGKMRPRAIYLYDSDFWNPLLDWFSDRLVHNSLISPPDMDMFCVVDDVETVCEKIIANFESI